MIALLIVLICICNERLADAEFNVAPIRETNLIREWWRSTYLANKIIYIFVLKREGLSSRVEQPYRQGKKEK